MIKHIVCWKLKDEISGEDKITVLNHFRKILLDLPQHIDVIQYIEVGINDPKIDSSNFDIVLIVTFNTAEDLQTYQKHSEHVKVKEFVKTIVKQRACVDFNF